MVKPGKVSRVSAYPAHVLACFYRVVINIDVDETSPETGGAADESKEAADDEILRVKIDATAKLGDSDAFVNFLPSLQGWYDISNSETYYRIEAVLRFNIINRHFDVRYEKGSGAPNFNEGRQISAGMTMSF